MRNYVVRPREWQVISKYCTDLDKKATALQTYIDFNNPNKIVLNAATNDNDAEFYSFEQLQSLGILCSTDDSYYININNMYPGQMIFNNYGSSIDLYSGSQLLKQNIDQGMAILKLDTDNRYQILSLDSAGDFYIVSKVLNNGDVIFSLLPKATVAFGLNYIFSFTAQNVRWCYRSSGTPVETGYSPTNWEGFSMVSWSWDPDSDSRIPIIISPYFTLWDVNSTISNEIMCIDSVNKGYQEVACETTTETSSFADTHGSMSIYNMTTNMDNGISDYLHMKVHLY